MARVLLSLAMTVSPQSIMRALRKHSLVIAVFAAASTAGAQPAQLQFSSTPPTPAVTVSGFYLGPFSSTLLSDPTLPTVGLFSLSYLNYLNWGGQFLANVSNLGQSNLSATKYGASSVGNYQKAAWLSSQFAQNSSAVSWAEIQVAIWNVFTPGVTLSGFTGQNWTNAANTWAASNSYSTFGWNQYSVLTPVYSNGQSYGGEYLTSAPQFAPVAPTVTPEPATWLLLGTGLIGIVGFAVVRGVRV